MARLLPGLVPDSAMGGRDKKGAWVSANEQTGGGGIRRTRAARWYENEMLPAGSAFAGTLPESERFVANGSLAYTRGRSIASRVQKSSIAKALRESCRSPSRKKSPAPRLRALPTTLQPKLELPSFNLDVNVASSPGQHGKPITVVQPTKGASGAAYANVYAPLPKISSRNAVRKRERRAKAERRRVAAERRASQAKVAEALLEEVASKEACNKANTKEAEEAEPAPSSPGEQVANDAGSAKATASAPTSTAAGAS